MSMANDARAIAGHRDEYEYLVGLLGERPGLVVVAGDPLSGSSDLLALTMESAGGVWVECDARGSDDALDLAMTVADAAVSALAPEAETWWTGHAAPSSTAGLSLWQTLGSRGVDPDELREGSGPGAQLLAQAIEMIAAIDPEARLLIDHLGLMLAGMPEPEQRELLGQLRAGLQRNPRLDLVLVEHTSGPLSRGIRTRSHPLFQAGEVVEIRRSPPERIVREYVDIRSVPAAAAEDVLGVAAELARGAPPVLWRIVELVEGGEVLGAWRRLRHLTEPETVRQWDLLRRVHPQAQPVVAALSAGLGPHSVSANPKSINDALGRLRLLGVVWQPAARRWSLADPLLAAWARDSAPSWIRHLGGVGAGLRPEGR